MKLLLCKECGDIKSLKILTSPHDSPTRCDCGKAWGYYKHFPKIVETGENKGKALFEDVRAGGEARIFGINNISFTMAARGTLATFEGWFYDTGYIETDSIEYDKEEE